MMRDELVARGLLTSDFKLTPAGNERVEQILDELQVQRATGDSRAPRVKWKRGANRVRAMENGR